MEGKGDKNHENIEGKNLPATRRSIRSSAAVDIENISRESTAHIGFPKRLVSYFVVITVFISSYIAMKDFSFSWKTENSFDAVGKSFNLISGDSELICPGVLDFSSQDLEKIDDEYEGVSDDFTSSIRAISLLADDGNNLSSAESSLEDIFKSDNTKKFLKLGLLSTISSSDISSTMKLVSENSPGKELLSSGVQSNLFRNGDLRGLAASACNTPLTDQWIVGGSTAAGRDSVVSLANASDVAAVVNLEIYGKEGKLRSTGTLNITVPANSTKNVSLLGAISEEDNLVIRILSPGYPVTAYLQHSIVRGVLSGGVEFIAPTALPSREQNISGIRIREPNLEVVDSDSSPVIRVFVPGEEKGHLDIDLASTVSADFSKTWKSLDISAGQFLDISLKDVTPGDYGIRLRSSVPIIASVRILSGNTAAANDFTWVNATRAIDRSLFTFVDGYDNYFAFTTFDEEVNISVSALTVSGSVVNIGDVEFSANKVTVLSSESFMQNSSEILGLYLSDARGDLYANQLLEGDSMLSSIDTSYSNLVVANTSRILKL